MVGLGCAVHCNAWLRQVEDIGFQPCSKGLEKCVRHLGVRLKHILQWLFVHITKNKMFCRAHVLSKQPSKKLAYKAKCKAVCLLTGIFLRHTCTIVGRHINGK